MNKLAPFMYRLEKIGIYVELSTNIPWVYIDTINGKDVTETFRAEHGFTVAFLPIRKGQQIEFTDVSEIFKLIRKYCNNE
jgi:hypothetical protein